MWFIDKLSQIAQYGWGQANAPYVIQVDETGTPLGTNAGALNTFENAAMGYDPSTGRTPVEQTNNFYFKSGGSNESIKSAPGFVHTISISAKWTGTATADTGVNVFIYDATSATNSVYGLTIPAVQGQGVLNANFTAVIDGAFSTGIWITVSPITGNGATFVSNYTTVTYR